MDYIFVPLGNFFVWIFEKIMEPLANNPNNFFIVLGFVLMGVWLWKQGKYNKEAAKNPNQLK